MAERSTATSTPQHATSALSSTDAADTADPASGTAVAADQPTMPPRPPELHSGHKIAKRYRLEECITRLAGFSSWRAVDEKLRRAVGIHALPAHHERARQVLSAARSAALLGDPRFVHVLDAAEGAAEEKGLVYIVHEWLPDATPLSTVLQTGPLDAYEAQALATQISEAMAAAHREGLAHLRLTPATVLRTAPCQYRIRGLAVDAALRGISSPRPQRTDTEAIGAILYAALTQRWPYRDGAHGLSGIGDLGRGTKDPRATPEQLRAGIHRGLSNLAMRALNNDGATAASQHPPCATPEEFSRAVAALPRIPPPEPTPTNLRYQTTSFEQGGYGRGYRPEGPRSPASPSGPPTGAVPPTLPGRTGTALKWGVSALLLSALGLGSWQLADVLMKGDVPAETPEPTAPANEASRPSDPQSLAIQAATDFDPFGTPPEENSEDVGKAIDDDPTTFWNTDAYYGPAFGNLKPGVGLVLDLGRPHHLSSLTVEAIGETPVEFRAAPSGATAIPTDPDNFLLVAKDSGDSLTLKAEESIETRFVLVWLTDLPQEDDGNYRGRIANITVFR